jgi:hypothetical protein
MIIKSLLAASIVASTFIGATAPAHASAFVKLGDIKGEATDNDHKDWVLNRDSMKPTPSSRLTDPTWKRERRSISPIPTPIPKRNRRSIAPLPSP